ncbi:GABA permease [Clostridium pasteurianum DSM 525 = ATCC 6013]|uniref:Amino acid permease-associated region n=1 Tax=Clostridium pasteurianum DSM 525 = ATCC 6013 TaxID=1262449 RepID=A0A0H3J1E0_CLOPA|nr:amino acid permease [Clostridium pasteurianum]AJA46542.1 GABA permease [Clostridium pasteurianum DSM 525 = ATCC 6013]AJA50530.1 GABA permease [Clostridium pasteurianum DSM 525 = ATCC 6013]AOZ73966.1 amino acid permease [Clostridium pasteurianum DSM 525 = ATCC 6013]AOZ77763.1 amino acid permease [Clostridium pasteurianum]ELP61114.1 amino acid permease [Clostridium pasteurianum DSM 525 = ATCC 6013]
MEKKHKGLSAGQLTMMALGTIIGGSFFLGSSVSIHAAGPAVLISYVLGGVLVYFILSALSEMTVADPSPGSFRAFASKAFGSGAAFVVGWVYWTGMILAMSSEAAAVSILFRRWFPSLSVFLLGSIVITVVTVLNFLGADRLSKLESSLAAVKLLAILSFIIIGISLVMGFIKGAPTIGTNVIRKESFIPGGIKSITGSMLVVIFAYAGFEIIGLAASETDNPEKTIPKAIFYTILALAGLYIVSIIVLLILIPTADLNEEISPMVAALNRWGMGWAGNAINIVMITAILSTMLAAMFGMGRMLRSLVDEGHAPKWLKDKSKVPHRGIVFSGFAMFLALIMGIIIPKIYMFLISSGGFALLFTYAVIVATQIRLRQRYGSPKKGQYHIIGYPYSSWITLISLIIIIISMPFISGQTSGLVSGLIIIAFYTFAYMLMKVYKKSEKLKTNSAIRAKANKLRLSTEFSEELTKEHKRINKDVKKR